VLGGLNSFYLLLDEPEVYGLPSSPKVPSSAMPPSLFWSVFTGLLVALGVLFRFRLRPQPGPSPEEARP
jgi:formate dehydrogenase iron-sulfur subunit